MGYFIMLDLDGTLLNRHGELSSNTIKTIKSLKNRHRFIIATGRPYHACIHFYNQLELDTPLITDNGGYITNPSNPDFPVFKSRLDLAAAQKLFTFSKPFIRSAFFNEGNIVYTYKYLPKLHEIFKNHDDSFKKVEVPFDEIDIAPSGIIYLIDVNKMEEFENFLDNDLKHELSYRKWGNDYQHALYEIYVPNVSKYTAIEYVMDHYQGDHNKTIAFGDGINDLEMLKGVKHGVAMKNGLPEVKSACGNITLDTNQEDGVVKYLVSYLDKA